MADLEPRRGPPDTLAQRLRDYLELFDPDLLTRWHGADEALVGEYARLSGFEDPQSLPPAYRSYLRVLGLDDGGLFADLKLDARLDDVVELYRECIRSEPDTLNPTLPICGVFVVGDQISFDRRDGSDEPPVVETSDGEWFAALSRDWEALVMQAAILRVQPRRLAHGRWFSSSATSLEKALGGDRSPARVAWAMEEFAAQHGLASAWPSDPRHHILLGNARSLYARVGVEGGLLLYAFAMEEEFLRAVHDKLAPRLGTLLRGATQLENGLLRDASR
ncbi:hypothetical protein ACFL5O_02735 [Myxococcota bacterium]